MALTNRISLVIYYQIGLEITHRPAGLSSDPPWEEADESKVREFKTNFKVDGK